MKSLAYKNDTSESSNIALTKSRSDSSNNFVNFDPYELQRESSNRSLMFKSTSTSSLVGMKNEEDKTALDIAKDAIHGPLIIRY
jgi:hypothetical protein